MSPSASALLPGPQHERTHRSLVREGCGQPFQVFFVVAPDGLCYYFHAPLELSR
jgi:hypothetical protein